MFYEKPAELDNEVSPMEIDGVDNLIDKSLTSEKEGEGNGQEDEDIEDESESKSESESESESDIEIKDKPTVTTRSGRAVKPTQRLIESEMGATGYEIALSQAEIQYYNEMKNFPEGEFAPGEIACVGAGLGGGFENTNELHVMKYNAAMNGPDAKHWVIGVDEEHDRMEKHQVFESTPRENLPHNTKVMTSTWAMKKKANGAFRARLNARGYEQIDGVHYDENAKFAPVVSDATIHIVMILMIMAVWWSELLDVKGAFLHGIFEKGRRVYMEVPQGFEKHYPGNVVLLLRKTLYGTKQAAKAFWIKLLEALIGMKYTRSKADPCLYYRWTIHGLILWISWVDDCLICGKYEGVQEAKKDMMKRFDCDEVGELKEYVGCKVEHNKEEGWIKLTQPVLLQSYDDEFELPKGESPRTPAIPGEVLQKGEEENQVSEKEQSKYRSGVGKLLHMMKWTRPEILNAVRELSRFMSGAAAAHMKAMYRVMNYCVATPKRGLLLKPNMKWNGDPNFEFVIKGRSDSDYAKDPERRRSVSGYSTFLCDAPVTMKSRMQGCVTLDVTSAELVSGTQCVQDMLFIMRVVESIGLKVKKPMILEMDNKGAVDISHNWSVSGRTRHDSIRQSFIRELVEEGIIEVIWISTDDNSTDLFTKNLSGPTFEKHAAVYNGNDEYMKSSNDSQGEGVKRQFDG
jgi:hypothetical protein